METPDTEIDVTSTSLPRPRPVANCTAQDLSGLGYSPLWSNHSWTFNRHWSRVASWISQLSPEMATYNWLSSAYWCAWIGNNMGWEMRGEEAVFRRVAGHAQVLLVTVMNKWPTFERGHWHVRHQSVQLVRWILVFVSLTRQANTHTVRNMPATSTRHGKPKPYPLCPNYRLPYNKGKKPVPINPGTRHRHKHIVFTIPFPNVRGSAGGLLEVSVNMA